MYSRGKKILEMALLANDHSTKSKKSHKWEAISTKGAEEMKKIPKITAVTASKTEDPKDMSHDSEISQTKTTEIKNTSVTVASKETGLQQTIPENIPHSPETQQLSSANESDSNIEVELIEIPENISSSATNELSLGLSDSMVAELMVEEDIQIIELGEDTVGLVLELEQTDSQKEKEENDSAVKTGSTEQLNANIDQNDIPQEMPHFSFSPDHDYLKSRAKPTPKYKRKKALESRLKGEPYTGFSRSKDGVVQQNKKVQGRQVKERCSHSLITPKSDRSYMCAHVTETTRQNQFEYFWNLATWGEKEAYIKGVTSILVQTVNKKYL